MTLGAYRDANENHPLRGRLHSVAWYDAAAGAEWVAREFARDRSLAEEPPRPVPTPVEFVVRPYLQCGTQTGMTVMWQTSVPCDTTVHFGATAACDRSKEVPGSRTLHEVHVENLLPHTPYFYRVASEAESGETLQSEVRTFVTAVPKETPFAFAVISDTQGNPEVAGRIAKMAWAQRPSFLLHPGDLVDTGGEDRHWTRQFFPSMEPLVSRVPFYPVLGNHERDHRNYYDYMALPAPEYHYSFTFGNAEFFMIDSNRDVSESSRQYGWLDQALAASDATWKFVCHHHPPYSSDENDYGDLWKTNESSRGDLRLRPLTKLYDRHGVDVVWNGHIHSYERTWPLRSGKPVTEGGTVYMVTGGGGGSLETAGPIRPAFQNTVRHGHHCAMVRINGPVLEFQAYDLENRLFDTFTVRKR